MWLRVGNYQEPTDESKRRGEVYRRIDYPVWPVQCTVVFFEVRTPNIH